MDQLIQEESMPDGFKVLKVEVKDMNALVLQKDDVENPIFRLDMIIEKLTPRQLFEILKDQANIPSWFNRCVSSKLMQTAPDGGEIFSTVYKGAYPLNNREGIHRRLIHCEDAKHLYMINYTTMGLENVSIPNLYSIRLLTLI